MIHHILCSFFLYFTDKIITIIIISYLNSNFTYYTLGFAQSLVIHLNRLNKEKKYVFFTVCEEGGNLVCWKLRCKYRGWVDLSTVTDV